MTTTAAAIRDAMLTLAEGLTPALESATPFRRFREQNADGFRAWCEAHPADCLRRMSIRYAGSSRPAAVSNTLVEEPSDTFEIVISYPANLRYGSAIELDDVITSDQVQVHARIGPPGYASLTAPATVLHEENWSREEGAGVVFAVIRYRVDYYRATGAVPGACQVVGTGGRVYATGDVITGETDIRAIYLVNGLAKLTHTTPSVPGAETLAHYLHVADGAGGYTQAVGAQYGDWAYYCIGAAVPFDRATVVEATAEAVEVVLQVDAYSLSTFSGGGVPALDDAITFNYPESSATFKRITSIVLTKVVRMQRGEAGYYVGWHSSPRIGPANSAQPTYNYVQVWGERELGTGGGTAVAFSSAGRTSRHPAWGAKSEWDATAVGVNDNRPAWMGIRDPFESPWNGAAYIATQEAGFPANQAAPPYWVADIHETIAVVRYGVARGPFEVGVWQFGTGARGAHVWHFVNELHSAAGIPYRHQLFFGAEIYAADSSSAFANEPKAWLRARIATLAAGLDWPLT